MSDAPTGMGLYARRLGTSKAGPKRLAKKARDHGLKHLELMGPWQEPKKGSRSRIVTRTPNGIESLLRYSEALAANDVAPLIWFYPWAGEENRILDFLGQLMDRGAPITGFLPDPELGSKWKGRKAAKIHSMRGAQGEAIRGSTGTTRAQAKAAAVRLMRGLADLVAEHASLRRHGIGVTSYGILRYHKTLPIKELLNTTPVWLSPQLYTATPELVDDAIDDWRKRAGDGIGDVVPSFATFGPNSGLKLLRHLISFVDGDEDVHGLMGWSVPQTSAREWNVIALFADWLERGLCALGGAMPSARRALERISR